MTGPARALALLVAGAYFMEILDATVIAPAAPHIAVDLGVTAVSVNVAITAYVLFNMAHNALITGLIWLALGAIGAWCVRVFGGTQRQ